jgi:HD-like signal output (HDOD) protein
MSSTEAMHRALTGVVSRGDFVVPPYPAVAMRLQRLLARDTYGITEVADVIAADAALAASVLAVANSALVGGTAAITSLSRAVNRLGARTVGAIAVASGIGAASLSNGVLLEVKFRVWRRGMTCALACQKLSASRGLVPEEAFLAGLLHGFGRSIAVASLEQLLKTHQPPRPLSAQEWLNIAEQQRAPLALAIAKSWQLPAPIADAMAHQGDATSPLHELVLRADRFAEALDARRLPEPEAADEARLFDELIAGLPATLDAFAPPAAGPPMMRPSSTPEVLAKPERALDGELRPKPGLKVTDRRSKGAAELTCSSLGPSGLVVESSRPFQEGAMVRVELGEGETTLQPWMTVVLCMPQGAHFRVELALFSPTRETREAWRALYDAT